VVKLYVPEEDSPAYLDLACQSEGPLMSSEALTVELYYALRQKELRGEIRRGATEPIFRKFRGDVLRGRLFLLPFGADVVTQAVEAARRCYACRPLVTLRSMDGIHLASALAARIKNIATTDERMKSAACVLGLSVVDPVSRLN
jgi:predicted nucleic acid-binding protein